MPPLSRMVKIQIIVVVLLGLGASIFAGFRYARMDQAIGLAGYRVVVHMEESGGIFEEAEVTYRGVHAGRVKGLSLRPGGVDVELMLDVDRIPQSSVAVVANRSAIGEQYLDLQPSTSAGPFLAEGSEIHEAVIPPRVQDVISSTIDLTETIPVDDLRTVVTELGKAFNGQGENLTRLVDSLDKLSATGLDDLDRTISLIKDSNVVLDTQAEQSDEILAWSRNLDKVTAQLAASDPAVRRILSDGPGTATALSTFLRDNGDDATKLIGQLGKTVHAVAPRSNVTAMTVAMLSQLSAGSHTVTSSDGTIRFGIVLETENPPSCTRGYESTQKMIADVKKRNPNFDINYDDFPFNTKAGCNVPVGNPTAVRGASRAQLSDPDYPQPWDNTAKKDPDKLNLNPIATQLAALMGVRAK